MSTTSPEAAVAEARNALTKWGKVPGFTLGPEGGPLREWGGEGHRSIAPERPIAEFDTRVS
ncbi:hypothetical protein ACWET9_24915 [Streptomyces sp. NPDC004059]